MIVDENSYLFRYLHMVLGALAVGGLAVALIGRFHADRDLELADHAERVGLRVFLIVTLINTVVGTLYLLALPRGQCCCSWAATSGLPSPLASACCSPSE